jgi:hypothetical protein
MREDILCIGRGRSTPVLEITREDEQRRFEDNVESRLKDLGDRIAAWIDSPYFMLITQKGPIRGACEELVVQQGGLRWIVSIAKRSRGSIRARLWLDIERALSDLESMEAQILVPDDDSYADAVSDSGSRLPPLDLETWNH